jgi:hypothetical protein
MNRYTAKAASPPAPIVTGPDGSYWSWDGRRWRPVRSGTGLDFLPPVLVALLSLIATPVVFLLRLVAEILARALTCALAVVVAVFALGATVALLGLFLTHT